MASDAQATKRHGRLVIIALFLLTTVTLFLACDVSAHLILPNFKGEGEDCIYNDPVQGVRGIPNCIVYERIPEGELTRYKFNDCGYRTVQPCAAKPRGAYRIVLIGSSTAMGMRVPAEKTFAELLPRELSQKTGQSVELYNQGMPWRPPHVIASNFQSVLAARPNLIIWLLSPSDAWQAVLPQKRLPESSSAPSGNGLYHYIEAATSRVQRHIEGGPGRLFRHIYYLSASHTIRAYLRESPDEEFERKIHGPAPVKIRSSPEWEGRLEGLDRDIGAVTASARQAGVPLVATLLPERPQAAMMSNGRWPPDVDPYKLDREVQEMVASRGATFIDLASDYKNFPNTELWYFPLDGHLNARGHAMIAALLTRHLTEGTQPLFRQTGKFQALERDRGSRRG
jgi:hypothetical protein